eukprot:2697735-Ditylum_brightwellii.AAC.1
MGLPILGVFEEEEEQSSEEEKEADEEKKKKDDGQSSASVATPAGLTKDTYSLRNQQHVAVFSSTFELQATGGQACRDCPLTHSSGLEAHNDMC